MILIKFSSLLMIILNLNLFCSVIIQNIESLKDYFKKANSFSDIENLIVSGDMVLNLFSNLVFNQK